MANMLVSDLIRLNESINCINGQSITYPIGIAVKISLLTDNVNRIFLLILNRLYDVLGKDVDFMNMTDEQKIVYDVIASSEIDVVDIVPHGLSLEDIICDDVKCTVSQADVLRKLFDKNQENNLK